MRITKSTISSLLCLVLSAGLVISSFHSHDLSVTHHDGISDTGHQVFQTIDTCPICSIVFKGDIIPDPTPQNLSDTSEITPLFSDRISVRDLYRVRKGRSPPSLS